MSAILRQKSVPRGGIVAGTINHSLRQAGARALRAQHPERLGAAGAAAGRRAELTTQRRKLFPIRLFDFEALQDWECPDSRSGGDLAEEVRQYFIPDFTAWKEHDAFEAAFARLRRDLQAVDAPRPPALTPRLAAPTSSDGAAHVAVLAAKRRRPAILEVQAARTGYNAPPEVVMEIEDLREEIAALEGRAARR